MSTQRLQHALCQALTRLRHEYDQLDATISGLEARLGPPLPQAQGSIERQAAAAKPAGGGRSSAGWTDDARAAVAARMRAYWQGRREQKARAQSAAEFAPAATGRHALGDEGPSGIACGKKMPPSRSTAGWTDQARAEAASRMRARWQARRGNAVGRA